MTTGGAREGTGNAGTYPMGTAEPTAARGGRGRGGGRAAAIVGILVILVAVWIVLAAFDDSAGPQQGVTLEQVTDEPDELEGRSVTVSGELAEFVVPGRAFPLGEGFRDTVLVIPASGTQVPPLEEDDVLQVTGVVHARFEPAELDDETDLAVEDEIFDPFDGRPVIVATSITEIPTDEDND